VDNPCPPCQEWADLLARERANLDKVMKELTDLQNKLPPLAEQQRKLQNAIKSLEAQIASQEGTGASSFDPETGITITAITEASGDVRVTTRDANGNVIEEHTRERRDTSKIKAEIKAKEAEIQKLKDQEAQIQKDIDYNNKLKEKTERAIKTAQEGLEECIKTKCNPPTETALAEAGPQVALVTGEQQAIVEESSMEPGTTGPATPSNVVPQATLECPKPAANEAIQVGANSEVGSGARAVEKVKETAGGFLGGLIGDSMPFGIGGGGGSSEPETVNDPVPDDKKQTFTASDGTAIKLGGMMTPEGMLVSTDIESSPGDGTFQTIFLENSQGQRAGPVRYLVYEMYQDWSLTVSWTHDRYVDGQHVSHEEGGWSEGGTNFLGSFKVPQAGEGIWSQMGFGNGVKGIKSLGTMYPVMQEQLAAAPMNVVVHVTRPKEDPVITTPFIFWAMPMPDGGLSFQQADQTYIQMHCGKLPLPGGGMQQIDPPASGPSQSEESILDDIDEVPVIAN
jgi:YD repeat-containing protein